MDRSDPARGCWGMTLRPCQCGATVPRLVECADKENLSKNDRFIECGVCHRRSGLGTYWRVAARLWNEMNSGAI